jgi:hypothetical protein
MATTIEELRDNLQRNITECQERFRAKLTQAELGDIRVFFIRNRAATGDEFLDNYVKAKTFLENISNAKKSQSRFGWLLECCARRRRGPRIHL